MAWTASPMIATLPSTANGRFSITWIAHNIGFSTSCVHIYFVAASAISDGVAYLDHLIDLRLPASEVRHDLFLACIRNPLVWVRGAFAA